MYLLFVTCAKLGVVIFFCLLMMVARVTSHETKVHYTNLSRPRRRVFPPLFHPFRFFFRHGVSSGANSPLRTTIIIFVYLKKVRQKRNGRKIILFGLCFFAPRTNAARFQPPPKRSISVWYNTSVYIGPEVSLYIIKCSTVFSSFLFSLNEPLASRHIHFSFLLLPSIYLNKKFIFSEISAIRVISFWHFSRVLYDDPLFSTTLQTVLYGLGKGLFFIPVRWHIILRPTVYRVPT